MMQDSGDKRVPGGSGGFRGGLGETRGYSGEPGGNYRRLGGLWDFERGCDH